MTRVALYARYSTDLQSEASIEDQFRLCALRVEGLGYEVTTRYEDRGVSGASLLRTGVQSLLTDALAGKFDVVMAEALDRLSRDQEDIAGIYKRLSFAGVKIITLSEGEVSDLHIGLKGTMNALFLKDLADKTRRGLRGRIEAGKSAGGNSYGYNVVQELSATGEPVRGKRTTNEAEATIVTRIFEEYAVGTSPRAIAHKLNDEGIPGPRGRNWSPSTIYGNRHRGTGIINNELYIGRLVWNRLKYMKNPDTGKRVSRLNPPEEWIIEEVSELRLISQDLWGKVKARQKTLDGPKDPKPFWSKQRPKHLVTGLAKCGTCGGNYTKISKDLFGCATSRNKGLSVCDNRTNIRVDGLEGMILSALKDQLMAPDLFKEFADTFVKEVNKQRNNKTQARKVREMELSKIDVKIRNVIEAIQDGFATDTMKQSLFDLEARKTTLTEELSQETTTPVLLHPAMADLYREKVTNLSEALQHDGTQAHAFDAIRSLIEEVTLTPNNDGLDIMFKGDLATMIELAANTQTSKKATVLSDDDLVQIKLVAGA